MVAALLCWGARRCGSEQWSSTMDFKAWLGETGAVDEKDLTLPTRVVEALEKAWHEDVLEEDDVPDRQMGRWTSPRWRCTWRR